MAIKLVVLDMAGTTVKDEDNVTQSFIQSFKINGISVDPEVVNPLMGYHKPFAIETILQSLGRESDLELAKQVHLDFQEIMLEHYLTSPNVSPVEDAEKVFAELRRQGKRIALNTGFSKRIATAILTRFGWLNNGLIDDFIASDEVPLGRPHHYMIKELMSRANIKDPAEVAKVGDTPVDIEEGRNAGCSIVAGVITGPFSAEQLISCHPTHLLQSLYALPVIVQE